MAVADHARHQGLAAALLKRAWEVHEQLGTSCSTAPTRPNVTAASRTGR
ncbi:hypothetical protein [Streptomyces litchfieldiae]